MSLKEGMEQVRQRWRLLLFDIQPYLEGFFLVTAGLLALGALALLLWEIGFYHTPGELQLLRKATNWLLVLFLLHYLLRLLTALEPLAHLRSHRVEAVLFFFVLLDLAYYLLLGRGAIQAFLSPGAYAALVHLALISFILVEVSRQLSKLAALPIEPARLVVFSFLVLILIGSGLLMLPRATVAPGSMPFLDALFTATSAVCVTGLIVVDTATYFTHTGHWIILMLIQLGGIGVISFATFLAAFGGDQPGLRHLVVLQGVFDVAGLLEARYLLMRVVTVTLSIELVGALVLYGSWQVAFPSTYERFFYSLFHAVSAFCNAGFALFTNSLADPVNAWNPALNATIMALIVLGGLGFGVLWEMGTWWHTRRMQVRSFFQSLSVHSRLVLLATAGLMLMGTLAFFLLEGRAGGQLAGLNTYQQIMGAFFQSITTRTAGFNTINIGALSLPALVITIVLMFIGASPGSTGGGIKTTTFAVLVLYIRTYILNREEVEVFHRFLARRTLRKALVNFAFGISVVTAVLFLLTLTEPFPLADLIFEAVSAFATVGLSRGITPELSAAGKLFIILAMFSGRVGMLTLAAALARRVRSTRYRFPEVTIGVA